MILKAESRNAWGIQQGSVLEWSRIYQQASVLEVSRNYQQGSVLETILLYFHDLTSGHQSVTQPQCNLPMQLNHVAVPGILMHFHGEGLHEHLEGDFF